MFFGALSIALGTVAFAAYSIYNGTIEGPFSQPFITGQLDFASDVRVPCPPPDTLPLPAGQVVVRTMNGTDISGLAGKVLEDLSGRGYYTDSAINWSRTYEGTARIMVGPEGIAQGYTVARNFKDYEIVLDDRTGPTVDVVLGTAYDDLRVFTDPLLASDLELSTDARCLPAEFINPEPAPRTLPKDPFAVPSVSPSASPADPGE